MGRRIGDTLAAPVVALWAVVVLPGWSLAERLMTTNSMLLFVDSFVGLVVLAATAAVTLGAVGIGIGLLTGNESARLAALTVGCVTTVGSLTVTLGGGVPSTDGNPWVLGGWLLGLVGGPVVVALIVAGGELLPPPRRRRPAPRTLQPTPVAATPVTATSEDYWLQVASRPAPHPSELPDDPFWEDLNAVGWLIFGLCAGAIGLGVYWFGGRWHRGPHPIVGALLIASAIGVGWLMDRARRRQLR